MESMPWQRRIKMERVGLVLFCGVWQRVWLRRRGVHLCLGVMGRVLMLRGGILVEVDMEGMEGGN
jgi:hypothetical protein